MVALAKANEVRFANADLVKLIRESGADQGRSVVASTLEDLGGDDPVGGMPIRRLLLAIPKFGEKRAGRYLRAVGLFTGDRRVRELSDRQRAKLAALLRAGVGFGVGAAMAFREPE